MRRILALLLSAVLAAGLFAGCATDEKPYVPTGDGLTWDEATKPTGSAVTEQGMSLAYYPNRSLNPYQSSDFTNRTLFNLLYQSLFVVDADYNVTPILCKNYSISRDMKTYTFYPEEATFSDGAILTASDVSASLRAACESDVYKGRFGYVKDIATTDDGAVTVTLDTPYENFVALLDVPIVKKDQVSSKRPLGTGPYMYEEVEEQLRLRRRADWWCAASLPVTAEKIALVEGRNPAQLRDEFEFSDLSLVVADPGSESYVDFHSDYELWDCENGIFLYLACNRESAVFSKQKIRAALTYAIDRELIAEGYYRGFAYGAVLPASPQSPYYSPALANSYTFDAAKLTQAVAAAGLETNNVVLLVNTDDGIRLRAARAIAQMLNECGLKVTTSELNGDDYRTALAEGTYDLYLGQTKLTADMDLSAFFATEGTLSFGGMEDPTMYALCLEALANSGNYYTLHQRILEDGMLCPILFRSYAIFTQRGMFTDLVPARDNVLFYTLGRDLADALLEE